MPLPPGTTLNCLMGLSCPWDPLQTDFGSRIFRFDLLRGAFRLDGQCRESGGLRERETRKDRRETRNCRREIDLGKSFFLCWCTASRAHWIGPCAVLRPAVIVMVFPERLQDIPKKTGNGVPPFHASQSTLHSVLLSITPKFSGFEKEPVQRIPQQLKKSRSEKRAQPGFKPGSLSMGGGVTVRSSSI